jgi:hypothetical protein
VSRLGGGDHGLGRRTAGVDAGAAQLILFDERHGPAVVGQFLRKRVARLPGTNHDGVVVRHECPSKNVLRGEARVGQRSHGSSYSAWPPCNTGCACPACQNDFASLPGEFATVGKLIQRRKTEWSGKLRPKKN